MLAGTGDLGVTPASRGRGRRRHVAGRPAPCRGAGTGSPGLRRSARPRACGRTPLHEKWFMTTPAELVVFYPSPRATSSAPTRPRSSGDRATASGAVCAGSNPAGGTSKKVPKDPVTSGNAEAGVFAYVQPYAARSGRMPGSVDYSWTESRSVCAGQPGESEPGDVDPSRPRPYLVGGTQPSTPLPETKFRRSTSVAERYLSRSERKART